MFGFFLKKQVPKRSLCKDSLTSYANKFIHSTILCWLIIKSYCVQWTLPPGRCVQNCSQNRYFLWFHYGEQIINKNWVPSYKETEYTSKEANVGVFARILTLYPKIPLFLSVFWSLSSFLWFKNLSKNIQFSSSSILSFPTCILPAKFPVNLLLSLHLLFYVFCIQALSNIFVDRLPDVVKHGNIIIRYYNTTFEIPHHFWNLQIDHQNRRTTQNKQ